MRFTAFAVLLVLVVVGQASATNKKPVPVAVKQQPPVIEFIVRDGLGDMADRYKRVAADNPAIAAAYAVSAVWTPNTIAKLGVVSVNRDIPETLIIRVQKQQAAAAQAMFAAHAQSLFNCQESLCISLPSKHFSERR